LSQHFLEPKLFVISSISVAKLRQLDIPPSQPIEEGTSSNWSPSEEDSEDDGGPFFEGHSDEDWAPSLEGDSEDDQTPSIEDGQTPSTEEGSADRNGLLRVGPQPLKAYPFIRTGPFKHLKVGIFYGISRSICRVDPVLPGTDPRELEQRNRDIKSDIEERYFIPCVDGYTQIVCDFTGKNMSWAPGFTRRTTEALYPFAFANGQCQYHGRSNIGMPMAVLNWAKGKLPITVLPLLAVLLNAHHEPNFEAMKATMSWAYIAMENIATSARVFQLSEGHKIQAETWATWDAAKREAVQKYWRSGDPRYSPTIREAFVQYVHTQIERRSNCWSWIGFQLRSPSHISWTTVYQHLLEIASSYGLTQEEFEYCCTAQAPWGPTDRVFYPFHILSRPYAEHRGLVLELGYTLLLRM
jgi:hypothetical protein